MKTKLSLNLLSDLLRKKWCVDGAVGVNSNIVCIDSWHLIQTMNVEGFSVIGLGTDGFSNTNAWYHYILCYHFLQVSILLRLQMLQHPGGFHFWTKKKAQAGRIFQWDSSGIQTNQGNSSGRCPEHSGISSLWGKASFAPGYQEKRKESWHGWKKCRWRRASRGSFQACR